MSIALAFASTALDDLLDRLDAIGFTKRAREIVAIEGATLAEVISNSRIKHIVAARYALMWELRDTFGYSYIVLGRMLNRDHTTCIDGCRVHAARVAERRPKRLRIGDPE